MHINITKYVEILSVDHFIYLCYLVKTLQFLFSLCVLSTMEIKIYLNAGMIKFAYTCNNIYIRNHKM